MSSSLHQLSSVSSLLSNYLCWVPSSLSQVCSSLNWLSSSSSLISSSLNLDSSSLNLVSRFMNFVYSSLNMPSLLHPFQVMATSTGCLVFNRFVWFDELGRWTKVMDGRAGEFVVLSVRHPVWTTAVAILDTHSLCTGGRERGLDHQTHVHSSYLGGGERRSNMVWGAI